MNAENSGLNGKQKRYLRGLGNRLEAKVVVGHGGLSDNCIENLKGFLKKEEIVKVRLKPACGLECKEVSLELCKKTGAETVQIFGKTILLFLKNSENSTIKLP